jgi:uncharacterized protein DUF6934
MINLSPLFFAGALYKEKKGIMNLERYEYKTRKVFKEYVFYSEGPKGRIRKIVRFALMISDGVPYYNLSFGDWNEEFQIIDDLVVSNNGDTEKLLATVAAIIIEFSRNAPEALIFAEGSTPSRTRLYRMGINKLWNEINLIFDVYGVRENAVVELYRKDVHYRAFLIQSK